MHLTLVTTIYSISAWRIIRGQYLILKDVSQLKKHAVNTWLRYDGQMDFNVHDAVMIKPGVYGTWYLLV